MSEEEKKEDRRKLDPKRKKSRYYEADLGEIGISKEEERKYKKRVARDKRRYKKIQIL